MRNQPEKRGENELRDYMARQGWLTVKLAGSKFQKHLPDLLCIHPDFGVKFIEMKAEKGVLSDEQRMMFRKMERYGAKIYIFRNSRDYDKLFDIPNWSRVAALGQTQLPIGFGKRMGDKH